MEDDDEFSDLYADVVVQASSAISAMHRLTELRSGNDEILDNATRGEKEVREMLNGAEIVGGNHKIYKRGSECEDIECVGEEEGGGGGLINLPTEDGVISGSDCEDDSDSGGGGDGYVQKFDDKYDNRIGNSESRVANTCKYGGGKEIEEDKRKCGRIYESEKNVDGGDYNSQKKSLNYDSLSSKKRRVFEMARYVDKSHKKGDADMGDRELCFSRDIEDNQQDLGRENGGPNNASESCRTLDLDKCGSVRISDSVEDNYQEASDSYSNGITEATETSYDTSRRKTITISNKVSSAAESESSESSWSRHSRGLSCSPSPSVALSDKYIEKSNKHSKYPSSSLAHESQEAMTHKRYPSRDFKSRGVRQSTSDDRYCQRQRDNSRNQSNQRNKSNDMCYLKTRQTDKDASYAIDIKHHYNRHVVHGRPRAMVGLDAYENDVPYCGQPERFFTYSGGFCADYRLGPNQYWNIHPSSRYKAGLPDGPSMSGRHKFLEMSRMDYEALEDDSYYNQRRHPIHGNIVGSRKFTSKYSSTVNQIGTRFISRVDDMHFKMRAKGDYSPPLDEFDNKFVEGKYRRMHPSGGRDRNHLDHRCDRNSACNRREMEISRRGKRRHDGTLNNSDNLWYTDTEKPCAPSRGKFLGAYGPEPGVSERKLRCSWKGTHVGSGRYGTNIAFSDTRESLRCHHSKDHHVRSRHYQHSSNMYFMNESIKDDHDEDNFVRRRCQRHSEVLHSREEVYKSRQQDDSNTYFMNESIKDDHDEDNFVRRRRQRHSEVLHSREEVYKSRQQDDTIFHSEDPSYHFEKNSRYNRADDRHAFGRVAKLIDEREANRERSKMIREQDSSNGYGKSIQPHSHAQMRPRYQDSVDHLVVVGRKCTLQPSSSRRTSEAGQDEYSGTHVLMGRDDNQISKNIEASDRFHPEKAVSTNAGKDNATVGDKNQQREFLDIEEGQIITEEIQDLMKHVGPSEGVSQINDKGQPQTASDGNGEVQKLDAEKIQEIMVKMERRRERFKEPITMCRDSVKTSNPLPDLDVESGKGKLERSARKRRWAGT